MRRALARLLAVALTLGLTSAMALAALSVLARPPIGGVDLPFFFNQAPRNVHDLSREALRRLTQASDAEAERTLVRLGGAALPHVLPDLETLAPSARGRVALALKPLARRMGVASEDEFASEDAAVGFWARFWQDRAFDFRPSVVKRLVGRLAQRANVLRHDDLVHLDTYAVGELLRALGRIRTEDDVARAERLTRVLAHVTGRGPIIDRQMSVLAAAEAVREWRRFAAEEGADFATLDGPLRLVAMFTQTRYGSWFGRQVLALGERSGDGAPIFGISWLTASKSLLRLALVLGLSALLGAAFARTEQRLQQLTRSLAALGAAVASLPAVFAIRALGSPDAVWLRELVCVAVCATLGAAWFSRQCLSLSELTPTPPELRFSLRAYLSTTPSVLPWLTSALFSVEAVLHLDGVAERVLSALSRSEVSPGVTLAVVMALLVAALITIDATRPRHALVTPPTLVAVDPDKRRRSFALGAALLLLLAVCSLLGLAATPGSGMALFSRGARALLGYGLVTLTVSTLLGVTLGALAVSGPAALDRLLVLVIEIGTSLPALLWAAALSKVLGSGIAFAAALGCLRALDIAWLFRAELLRLASADAEMGARSLGRLPLSIYLRNRLRPAAAMVLRGAALTPAWTLAVAVAAECSGFSASAGAPGWERLLSLSTPPRWSEAALAGLILALTTWFLLWASGNAPRRLGALRSNRPPAPAIET